MGKLKPIGSDPEDQYSLPLRVEETKLGRVFYMNPRDSAAKPGRKLSVVWDSRIPLIEGFENNYSYTVTFADIGKLAGNHFHEKKQELFYPIIGEFRLVLEDIKSKEREEILLSAQKNHVLYVKPRVAHVVISKSDPAILLVTATYPNSKEDEFEYILTK